MSRGNNTIITLGTLPDPRSQTLFSRGYYIAIESTGAGKAFNPARLVLPGGAVTGGLCVTATDLAHRKLSATLVGADYQKTFWLPFTATAVPQKAALSTEYDNWQHGR